MCRPTRFSIFGGGAGSQSGTARPTTIGRVAIRYDVIAATATATRSNVHLILVRSSKRSRSDALPDLRFSGVAGRGSYRTASRHTLTDRSDLSARSARQALDPGVSHWAPFPRHVTFSPFRFHDRDLAWDNFTRKIHKRSGRSRPLG